MEPLPELPSCDDLASSGVESWLDSSSKYHSCEIVDEEQHYASYFNCENLDDSDNAENDMQAFDYKNAEWRSYDDQQ